MIPHYKRMLQASRLQAATCKFLVLFESAVKANSLTLTV